MFSPPRKLEKIQKIKKVKVRQQNCNNLKFGFATTRHGATRPMCLACGSIFFNEAMKPSRLHDHLNKLHPDKSGSDFKKLRDKKNKNKLQFDLFRLTDKRQKHGLIASYNISKLIAKMLQTAPKNSRLNVVVRLQPCFGLGRNGCWSSRGSS